LDRVADSGAVSASQRFATRIAALIGIAVEGVPITLGVAVAGVLMLAAGFVWLGAIVMLAAAAIGAFFRDPERAAPDAEGAVISAADGKVCNIDQGPLPGDPSGEIFGRVSVFMSPLDVHVNRAPISGRVASVVHTAGEFRAAFRDLASEHNERNLIIFQDTSGQRHAIIQIAGYLARRIVCHIAPEERITRGERLGLIMFGSRVDHFMPRGYRPVVAMGDRVRAGESIIGELER
jgi:phosphatidylserine decarboxylase